MTEISKAYEPQSVEDKWYDFWLKQNCFTADPKSSKPAYSIVMPPPNVTGVLTMGHVLNNTIQDILARKARMDGREVLWLPGTDHAGIATQTVVERTLKKSGEIRHRDDLGREKFLERVWQWKEKHGGIIIQQLKKLGASCDWTRERFTMDPEYSRCVQKVFVELYKKGLIYRGKRMVNWCPATQTALSDEEVVMKEQKGSLYYFRVEVVEKIKTEQSGPNDFEIKSTGILLTIATTRPETIPGDTAIAVNPKDPRYKELIGKYVIRPLPLSIPKNLKLIPIVGDHHVDFEFGTGVLKVTPAHDKADFQIYNRIVTKGIAEGNKELAGMTPIEVIDAEGYMTSYAGDDLANEERFEARKLAVWLLKKLTVKTTNGEHIPAFEKEEPHISNVGFSERADVPIEPRLSEQWFLRYPSTGRSREVVAKGEMKFHPERWAKVYDHWMGNIQDWCISRQLWWGHRIPVWYKKTKLEPLPGLDMSQGFNTIIEDFNPKDSFVGNNNFYVGVEPPTDLEDWQQDPDVLDTWFSSWLWPFATMGWPEQTDTLKKFYPTTDLVTGPDIIFFWVARMIMAGYEFMGDLPFKSVYFTGIIRDKQGRKMSKSLGNSPDPLDLIAKFGADALRFGVMRAAPLGQDILFDEQNVELGRNFCNKLWNACRFRQMQGGEVQGEINPQLLTSDDKWILLKLDAATRELDTAFAEYKFSDATATLYRFFWSEYCDWYVEASKAALQTDDAARKANTLAVIDFVLSHTIRLFHPFLPFITEELWHGMGYSQDMPENQGGKTIMFAPWPKPLDQDFKSHYGLSDNDEEQIEARNEFIGQGRNLRRNANIPANKKVKFIFKPAGPVAANDVEVLKLLLNAGAVEVNANYQPAKGALAVRAALGELFLPTEGLIDVDAEKARLKKELEKIESEIFKVRQKLANPDFTQKVPPQVLEEHEQRLADWQGKLAHAKAALTPLG